MILDYILTLMKKYNNQRMLSKSSDHYINLASNSLSAFNDSEEKNILKNLTSFSLAEKFLRT